MRDHGSVVHDEAERRRARRHEALQGSVLELIATGEPLGRVLETTCLLVEEIRTSGLCSILLLDEDGRKLSRGVGPSLPPAALRDLDGLLIGPAAGSCGTAAYCGELVVVSDTETDPRWAAPAFQTFARTYAVKACWSHPFFAKDRRALGTFAISLTAVCEPTDHDRKLLQTAAHLAGIAVERQREQDTLDRAYAGLETLVEARTRDLAETNERLLETQARAVESAKMAAVGTLVAGLCHEINNPLAVILGFAESVSARLPSEHPLGLPLRSIEREARRCKGIVNDLLGYAQKVRVEAREAVDLASVTRSVAALVRGQAEIGKVELEVDAPPLGPAVVLGSRRHLEQVILNIARNALDAMPGGGRLRIAVGREAGDVILTIEDTGTGIPAEIVDRIFEPFFTTKEVGKGTGLGLAISREIVDRHGGRIDVASEVGAGSRFSVRIPAVPEGARL